MSRFFAEKYRDLKAYTPGEQPQERKYIKLNTNENPYPPGPWVAEAVREEAERLRLYSDPESGKLRSILANRLSLKPENLIMTNGSDEALYFSFTAFCDEAHPAVFPDITYGFYPVYARICRVPFRTVPLSADWHVRTEDYLPAGGTVFLANPNAPTGISLGTGEIERVLKANPDHVVIVDEAYVNFGGESAAGLIADYDNLIVIQTFSKFRSLAGMRLGFAAGNAELIRDLKTIQYSTNPYNVDRLAQAAGIACLKRDEYNEENGKKIIEARAWTREALTGMGFETTDSRANFLFVRHPAFRGSELRDGLKERGILIRWFDQDRIRDWYRISIGTQEEMETLAREIRNMLEEKT